MGIDWGQVVGAGIKGVGGIAARLFENWAERPVVLKPKQTSTSRYQASNALQPRENEEVKLLATTSAPPLTAKIYEPAHHLKVGDYFQYRPDDLYRYVKEIDNRHGRIVEMNTKGVISSIPWDTLIIKAKNYPAPSLTAKPAFDMPTKEETTLELKRRLARELYKAELDLANGLKIAGKNCDCLSQKHTLMLDACAEEMVSQDPGNTVYQEIRQWIVDNQHKVTPEAADSGKYKDEYPRMALQFKEFRKRVLGTVATIDSKPKVVVDKPIATEDISLEEAKRIASETAMKETERIWKEQKSKTSPN